MAIHILLTGASRGIGAAIAESLAAHGDVRLAGHASRAHDHAPDLIVADLSHPEGPATAWGQALDRLDGRIDVLINNAGLFEAASIDAPDAAWLDSWERTLRVNLTAAADLSRRAVKHFEARGDGGRIVNIASRAAYRGDSPAHWHYAASKAGMVAMTKTIARGYAAKNILAFAICPGFTLTGMATDYLADRADEGVVADIPLGRVAMPDEVATAARFLATEAPASMTGAVIDINGASYVR